MKKTNVIENLINRENLIKYLSISENFEIKSLKNNFNQNIIQKRKLANSILFTKTDNFIVNQNNIDFLINIRKNDYLNLKPYNLKLLKSKDDCTDLQDVFSENNLKNSDLLIENNLLNENNFNILFNKFPVIDNHILLTTKDYKKHQTHISINEIRNMLIINSLFSSICVFNGGYNSGASQPRKHFQFVPLDNLFNCSKNKTFGIFKIVDNYKFNRFNIKCNININDTYDIIEETEYLTILKLNELKSSIEKPISDHILCIFNKNITTFNCINDLSSSLFIYYVYIKLLCLLGLIDKSINIDYKDIQSFYDPIRLNSINVDNLNSIYYPFKNFDDENYLIQDNKSYSFLLTENFMFLSKRKKHKLDLSFDKQNISLNLNSFSYMFSFLVKDKKEFDIICNENIIDKIFTEL